MIRNWIPQLIRLMLWSQRPRAATETGPNASKSADIVAFVEVTPYGKMVCRQDQETRHS
jgi:hypothetical protein